MNPLTEQQEKILNDIKSLDHRALEQLMWHVGFLRMEKEADSEAEKLRDEPPLDLFLAQGRIKAEYYARMRIATACLQKKQAVDLLDKIYENWDKMEKDAPIYWYQGKLVGETVAEESQ